MGASSLLLGMCETLWISVSLKLAVYKFRLILNIFHTKIGLQSMEIKKNHPML